MAERARVEPLLPLLYEPLVRRALEEDLGVAGDLTADALELGDLRASALLVARDGGRVAGLAAGLTAFRLLDPGAHAEVHHPDGDDVAAGAPLATVTGAARALLSGERTACNLVGLVSGCATATRDLVATVADLPTRVVPTRKTLPGLRALQRYAVRVGGGHDHRFGLDDAVLLKDNHLLLAGGLSTAVARVRRHLGHLVKVEVEVDTLDQLEEALGLGVDAALLDNMDTDQLRRGVALVDGRLVTEASGGVRPATAPAIAATGVDLVSVGWLTHSAPALDVALDLC
ncbi:MAG TPA: carboxylating nicotinate-nucleotide diphosphorylase [Acidimicrobiales bacterium]|nr:carboxylating nicotinate-nucleotide diphosphorylase [Acidimicrobiales bacterium]